jgi:hypothetical protein
MYAFAFSNSAIRIVELLLVKVRNLLVLAFGGQAVPDKVRQQRVRMGRVVNLRFLGLGR